MVRIGGNHGKKPGTAGIRGQIVTGPKSAGKAATTGIDRVSASSAVF
jgi:hypothetical protein